MNIPDSLTEVLQQLQSGLYIFSDDLPNHGFYVTKQLSKKTITFTLCSISLNLGDFYGTLHPQRLNMYIPVQNVKKFFIYFFKYYTPSEHISILAYDLGQNELHLSDSNNNLYINRSAQVAMWKTGEIFKIKDNKCVIGESGKVYFKLEEDNTVKLQSYDKQMILYPESLKSSFLMDEDLYQIMCKENWKHSRLIHNRNICKFKFLLEQNDRISVSIKIANPYACLYFSNRYLFNILSESIMKILTVLKNNNRCGLKHILDDKIAHDVLNL